MVHHTKEKLHIKKTINSVQWVSFKRKNISIEGLTDKFVILGSDSQTILCGQPVGYFSNMPLVLYLCHIIS